MDTSRKSRILVKLAGILAPLKNVFKKGTGKSYPTAPKTKAVPRFAIGGRTKGNANTHAYGPMPKRGFPTRAGL